MSTSQEGRQVAATRRSPALPTGHARDAAEPGAAQMQPAPEVLDGELITDAEYARRRGPNRLPVAVIWESDHSKKLTKAMVSRVMRSTRVAARAIYTVGQGLASWVRRAADALTHGPVREQVRLARLAGDREALAEWTERLVSLKDSRAERLRQLPATLVTAWREGRGAASAPRW
ncbi:MAG: hypothetical protein ACRDSF_16440, partial [Pseudonocardiaceae bacterium]